MARQLPANHHLRRWRLWGVAVIATALVTVVLLGFFLRRAAQTPYARYVVRPEVSVKGVAVGSLIRLKGVTVGQVTKVGLWVDGESGKIRPEIILSLDISKEPSLSKMYENVEKGLRVQFVPVNPASGFLEVDLVWSPGSPRLVAIGGSDELPWQPSDSQLAVAQVIPLVQKLSATDFRPKVDAFMQDLAGLESRVQRNAAAPSDLTEKSKRLRLAVQRLEQIVGPEALGAAQTRLADLREGLRMTEAALESLDRELVEWPDKEGESIRLFAAKCRQTAEDLRASLPKDQAR